MKDKDLRKHFTISLSLSLSSVIKFSRNNIATDVDDRLAQSFFAVIPHRRSANDLMKNRLPDEEVGWMREGKSVSRTLRIVVVSRTPLVPSSYSHPFTGYSAGMNKRNRRSPDKTRDY